VEGRDRPFEELSREILVVPVIPRIWRNCLKVLPESKGVFFSYFMEFPPSRPHFDLGSQPGWETVNGPLLVSFFQKVGSFEMSP